MCQQKEVNKKMWKEYIEKLDNVDQQYFQQNEKLRKGKVMRFQSYEEIVEFMAIHYLKAYCKYLVGEGKENMKKNRKLASWKYQDRNLMLLYHAFQGSLWRIYYELEIVSKLKKLIREKEEYHKIIIDSGEHSEIYDDFIEIMEFEELPHDFFPLKETYIIDLTNMSIFLVSEQ